MNSLDKFNGNNLRIFKLISVNKHNADMWDDMCTLC